MQHILDEKRSGRGLPGPITGRLADPISLPIFKLSASVGAGGENRSHDVQATKRALAWAGRYPVGKAQSPTGDADLDGNPDFQRAVIRFQRERNLRRDALLMPGGETERTLERTIRPLIESQEASALRQADAGADDRERADQEPPHGRVAEQPSPSPRQETTPGGARKRTGVPTINDRHERRKAIRENRPARFDIEDDSRETGALPRFGEFHAEGRDAIVKYDSIIEEEARKRGVDPDLVRAIVYVENARGWYDFVKRNPSSVRPMNINFRLWEGLGGIDPKNARDPRTNIRAGVELIKRIAERVDNPSPRVIASLWHFIGLEKTSKDKRRFAARVNYVYEHKIWEKEYNIDDPNLAP
jgi:hypothetical protein